MKEKQPTRISRRSFFGALGGASTAAVAAVTVLRPDSAQAYNPGEEETRSRYQETDHIKEYYRVNRYPTPKK